MKNIKNSLRLINLFTERKFYSTTHLSAELGIKSTEIKKHIKVVSSWGVSILKVPGNGYRLLKPIQLLNKSIIHARLPAGRLAVLPFVNSTNQYLIERIGFLRKGDACVAEYQASGRGRRGQKWVSPFGENICFSIYWRFEQGAIKTRGLGLMFSVVIAEILQKLGAVGVRVKWPNDLYLNDRKLAGVLVEINSKANSTAHTIIGAGINLTMSKTKVEAINQDWISLKEANISVDRDTLIINLTNTLRQALQQFERDGFAPFAARWQALDNFFNRPVQLFIGDREIRGIGSGISIEGGFLLKKNGKCYTYFSGEASLRNLLL